MQSTILAALIAAVSAALGWFANHWLTGRREERRRAIDAQLKFVERQIEELYGPVSTALYEGRRAFADLQEILGRECIFEEGDKISKEDLVTWLFWAEAEFLPRNEYIKTMLKTKAHLIDGPKFPKSHVDFLDHCNSWALNHKRWKEQQVKYSWRSKVEWPDHFESEFLSTSQMLKRRHAGLLGALTASPSFRRVPDGAA